MQALDGDLTEYVLKTAHEKCKRDGDTSMSYENMYKEIADGPTNDNKPIRTAMSPHITPVLESLQDAVIKLNHDLVSRGWRHRDYKLDNIGYAKEADGIRLYYLDGDALEKIDPNQQWYPWKEFLRMKKDPISQSGILGQWQLDSVFPAQDPSELKDSTLSENEHGLIVDKLEKNGCRVLEADQNWIRFQQGIENDSFVIQKILNKYRLIRFDSHGRHMSDPEYSKERNEHPGLDQMFDTIEDLFEEGFRGFVESN